MYPSDSSQIKNRHETFTNPTKIHANKTPSMFFHPASIGDGPRSPRNPENHEKSKFIKFGAPGGPGCRPINSINRISGGVPLASHGWSHSVHGIPPDEPGGLWGRIWAASDPGGSCGLLGDPQPSSTLK